MILIINVDFSKYKTNNFFKVINTINQEEFEDKDFKRRMDEVKNKFILFYSIILKII